MAIKDELVLKANNPSIQECFDFLKERELIDKEIDFYLFTDAFKKSYFLLQSLQIYFSSNELFKQTFFNAFTHYVIIQDYGNNENPLYNKYNIKNCSVMFSSVSDVSSSSTILQYNSLTNGDFLMADLTRTPYGTYVYQVLEQMNPIPVLL